MIMYTLSSVDINICFGVFSDRVKPIGDVLATVIDEGHTLFPADVLLNQGWQVKYSTKQHHPTVTCLIVHFHISISIVSLQLTLFS